MQVGTLQVETTKRWQGRGRPGNGVVTTECHSCEDVPDLTADLPSQQKTHYDWLLECEKNVRTLNQRRKWSHTLREMQLHRLDVPEMTEARWTGKGKRTLPHGDSCGLEEAMTNTKVLQQTHPTTKHSNCPVQMAFLSHVQAGSWKNPEAASQDIPEHGMLNKHQKNWRRYNFQMTIEGWLGVLLLAKGGWWKNSLTKDNLCISPGDNSSCLKNSHKKSLAFIYCYFIYTIKIQDISLCLSLNSVMRNK